MSTACFECGLGRVTWHGLVLRSAAGRVRSHLIFGGVGALRSFSKSLDQWRFGFRWYSVICLGPVVLALLVAAVSTLLGASWEESLPLVFSEPLPVILLLAVILSLTDGLGEEVGWRGYALPRMLEGSNATLVSVVLGVIWATWHLPLFFTQGSALEDASMWVVTARLPATAIIFTWVFVHTRGSVIAAIIFYATLNLTAVPPSVESSMIPNLVYLAAHWVIALTLVAVAGSRLDRWQTSPVSGPASDLSRGQARA